MKFIPRLFLLLSLLLPSLEAAQPRTTVVVASKNFTEGVVLGELLTHLARSAGTDAEHRRELGGTQIVFGALKKGDIDAYCDYTGTLALEILRDQRPRGDEEIRTILKDMGIGMSQRLGFNNTYAIGMKQSRAEALGIKTISDLLDPKHASLKVGFSDEFLHRDDGWPGLKNNYGLSIVPTGMDHNLAYRGLDGGSLDVTDLYSTDAEIRAYKLITLEDDKAYFPMYHSVILYSLDFAKRHPGVLNSFLKLEGRIDNAAMIEMNAQVKIDQDSESLAAARFLDKSLGLQVEVHETTLWSSLLRNTLDHLKLVLVSLFAAVLIAVPLGIAAARRPRLGQGILGLVGILQTIPSMAILVFMVPIFGLGPKPAIVALFLYSLLPIVRNTFTGLTGIAGNLKESAEVLGLPPAARLRLVELPLASPSILAGIKTAAVINVGTATIGALIGAGGYGTPILSGVRLADTGLILQGAVPAALMALIVQGLFELLEKAIVPKGLRQSR